MANGKLKIGILGGTRGMDFAKNSLANNSVAEVSAICEAYVPLKEKIEADLKAEGRNIRCFSDFDEFLQSGMDALITANFANDHVRFALKALNAGIHVYSESVPVQTMAEAVALCEAVEKSGCLYAYGENYCYLPMTFEMRKMYENGEIGSVMHAEANFINDCSYRWHLLTRGDRNHWRNHVPSTFYCTHSIGPLVNITGERAKFVIGMEAPRMPYMAEVGARSGSAAMEIMQLTNGAMAKSINGNYRRSFAAEYRIIGEYGTIETDTSGIIHLDKYNGTRKDYDISDIKPRRDYLWYTDGAYRDDLGQFQLADLCAFNAFLHAILQEEEAKKQIIDVYKALDMSVPGLLAFRSILNGSKPVDVPDLRSKEEWELWRNDHRCTDATKVSGEDLLPSCKTGFIDVDDSVYEKVAQDFVNVPIHSGMN